MGLAGELEEGANHDKVANTEFKPVKPRNFFRGLFMLIYNSYFQDEFFTKDFLSSYSTKDHYFPLLIGLYYVITVPLEYLQL